MITAFVLEETLPAGGFFIGPKPLSWRWLPARAAWNDNDNDNENGYRGACKRQSSILRLESGHKFWRLAKESGALNTGAQRITGEKPGFMNVDLRSALP